MFGMSEISLILFYFFSTSFFSSKAFFSCSAFNKFRPLDLLFENQKLPV